LISLLTHFKAEVQRFSSLSISLFEICNCSHSRNYQLHASCTSTPTVIHFYVVVPDNTLFI